MAYYVKLYFAILIAFFIIDMLWLGLVARGFYRRQIGFLLAPNPNWPAAILFYLMFVGGVLFFVVVPGLESGSLQTTLVRAALFGLITYATYDLTNLATVKNWPILLTVVDMAWGVVLSVSVSAVGFWAGQWLR